MMEDEMNHCLQALGPRSYDYETLLARYPLSKLPLKHPFTKHFFREWEKEPISVWFCW